MSRMCAYGTIAKISHIRELVQQFLSPRFAVIAG